MTAFVRRLVGERSRSGAAQDQGWASALARSDQVAGGDQQTEQEEERQKRSKRLRANVRPFHVRPSCTAS